MKKSYRILSFAVMLTLMAALAAGASLITAQISLEGVRTDTSQQTGKLTFVGASVASPVRIAQATANGLSKSERASAILAVYAPQFGVSNPAQDLRFTSEFSPDKIVFSRRYQQIYQGIPVFAGELIVNLTKDGGLVSMLGKTSPDLSLSVTPKLTAAQAQGLAIQRTAKDFNVSAATLTANSASLWIYDERLLTTSDAAAVLVWRVNVSSTVGAPINTLALVDAKKGYISLIYNQIDTEWSIQGNGGSLSAQAPTIISSAPAQQDVIRVPGTADLATYTTNNSTTLPGSFLCDESTFPCTAGANPDADAAHLYAKGTYDMYWNWHGRDSLNNAGLQLKSTVHFDVGYCNAFWNDV
ncbi:MAG TPA: hypothetical protein VHL11_06975, partial [Phototrophicaceae bacterium]|nr:hypothetical protein [Phototrophicaceae bacterium]